MKKQATGITLIKFGGSIITDKSAPNTVRPAILTRLISELKGNFEAGEKMVLAHGSGSFGHVPAAKYKTKEGFINDESRLGMAITQDTAAQLNRIVVQECLNQHLPAVSVAVSNSLVLNNGQVKDHFNGVLFEYLNQGLLPVTSGDVVVDASKGCSIWSADKILPFFTLELPKNGYQVKRIIHVTSTPGVYKDIKQPNKGVFSEISPSNINEVQAAMGATEGVDVTGGMWTKISECLAIAKQSGIESVILSGNEAGTLAKFFAGEKITATIIHA